VLLWILVGFNSRIFQQFKRTFSKFLYGVILIYLQRRNAEYSGLGIDTQKGKE